jgi:hypothetical protein
MHRNPVQRDLVLEPEEWLWSSYRHYAYDERGPVPVNETRKAELHIRKISWAHQRRGPPVKPPRVGHPVHGSLGEMHRLVQPPWIESSLDRIGEEEVLISCGA